MACDKQRYETYNEAIGAINGISRRDGQKMKSYKCKECGGFHLATEGKKRRMRNLKDYSVQMKYKPNSGYNLNPVPKIIGQKEPQYATEKMMSKEMAANLKRLIEGSENAGLRGSSVVE